MPTRTNAPSPAARERGGEYLLKLSGVDTTPMTAKEECDAFIRLREGCHDMRERIVHSNLRFVVSIAHQYSCPYLSADDLIAEGILGLTKAIDRFDPQYGVRFLTYAIWWIRQAILAALLVAAPVPVPRRTLQKSRHMWEYCRTMEQRVLRNVSEAEGYEACDIAYYAPGVVQPTISTHAHHALFVHAPSVDPFINNFPTSEDTPEEHAMLQSGGRLIRRVINDVLTEREAWVVKHYFGFFGDDDRRSDSGHRMCTLSGIADDLGLSKERIRQIKKKALEKIKKRLRIMRVRETDIF